MQEINSSATNKYFELLTPIENMFKVEENEAPIENKTIVNTDLEGNNEEENKKNINKRSSQVEIKKSQKELDYNRSS